MPYLAVLLLSTIFIVTGCNNEITMASNNEFLLVADREYLYVVDLAFQKKKLLYKADEEYHLSSPSYSPVNNSIAFAECSYRPNDCNLVVYNLETKRKKNLLLSQSTYLFPVWSPDGNKMAIQQQTSQEDVYQVSVVDNKGDDLYRSKNKNIGGRVSWAPKGKNILYENMNNDIVCENIETGKFTFLAKGHSPIFSSVGNQIAYIFDGKIMVKEIHSGETKQIIKESIFSHFDHIDAWINNNSEMIIGTTRISFIAEEHFLEKVCLDTNKLNKVTKVQTHLGYFIAEEIKLFDSRE